MKTDAQITPEMLWDAILSRDQVRILETWHQLNREEQSSLVEHLERMAGEPGWHPEQVNSAKTALEAIRGLTSDDRKESQ